jgi:hypothetical protein
MDNASFGLLDSLANAIQIDHLTNEQILELEKILNGIGE